jgi:hypothetical protein
LACKCTLEVKGCSSSFSDLLLMFCPKTFLFVMLFIPYWSLNICLHLLMQPSCRFLGNCWAQVLGLLTSPLGAPTSFPLYFSWGDWRHLHKVHYSATYLRSWALVAPIITTKFFSSYCLYLLEVIGFKSFNLFPF